ncbi:helix-turn-helix transcriptional regulator [Nonomuraea roseoviolacea]|uniref:DNA-binding transcriptional regulator YafY n=1 Tax=Nonomuraea roseoviolacea subsp. carminata TaxID=160689 RepID=A0ABT1KH21_9ACTN|nr:WYL domain-containing protein [Nonomuraea roseoviolacea]MCP2352882.1 putative DNA-binding transcriptional regulator YafY [Nonomuraea roseoviolacea subsp. carminata]
MVETSARLLRLLSLLQTRREWSGTELAERLGVTPRTVRRDVGRLRELGYPVAATAGAPGYRLGAGTDLPPLLLDDDEAVAVAVGLRTAAGGSVTGIEETSVRALAKLERVLPSRLRHRVRALQSMTVPMGRAGSAVDPAALTAIASACRDHETLRFDYRSHEGQQSARAAEPYRLVHSGRHWYLLGWDTGRAGWRTYRVDRLSLRTPNGPRFVPRDPPDADLAAYVSRSLSSAPYRYQGRFTMHAPAEVVAGRMPATVAAIEPIDARSCTLTSGANDLDELAVWVAQTGVDFDVHEPPELADHLLALSARLAAAAQRAGAGRQPVAAAVRRAR